MFSEGQGLSMGILDSTDEKQSALGYKEGLERGLEGTTKTNGGYRGERGLRDTKRTSGGDVR